MILVLNLCNGWSDPGWVVLQQNLSERGAVVILSRGSPYSILSPPNLSVSSPHTCSTAILSSLRWSHPILGSMRAMSRDLAWGATTFREWLVGQQVLTLTHIPTGMGTRQDTETLLCPATFSQVLYPLSPANAALFFLLPLLHVPSTSNGYSFCVLFLQTRITMTGRIHMSVLYSERILPTFCLVAKYLPHSCTKHEINHVFSN